jgi:Domain of unknown function(DUF2779)
MRAPRVGPCHLCLLYLMTTAPLLNLDDLTRWRACPKRFWLHGHSDEANAAKGLDPQARPMTDSSTDNLVVHNTWPDQALRSSFPQALVIDAPDTPAAWAHAIAHTMATLQKGLLTGNAHLQGAALFGACLASNDGAQVRIDVIAAGEHGLRLFKVRYATVGDDADVDAVALWAHVAARCGLRVQSVGMLLVDTDFIYPGHGCYAGLFREVDLSPVLGSRPVPAWLVGMRKCERGAEPAAQADAPCTQGSGCTYMGHCGVAPLEARTPLPASLEVVGRELAASLREEGHLDLMTVPQQRLPDARRRRALRAIQSGQPELDPTVALVMKQHGYPRYTLRFDTIGFATPIWPGTRPYQILPFQWVCDVEPQAGQLTRHAFLADKEGDPRRAFAESLLAVLGSGDQAGGPIFAYNAGFERNRLREMARLFEDLTFALGQLQARIVDLFQLGRAHYYHPAMCGSWSFKSVCRAVAPDVPTQSFNWHGVTQPQVAFALSQQEGLDATERQQLREALIAQGQCETQALRRMVALFEGATMGRVLKIPTYPT